jgi:hypothetical protein
MFFYHKLQIGTKKTQINRKKASKFINLTKSKKIFTTTLLNIEQKNNNIIPTMAGNPFQS